MNTFHLVSATTLGAIVIFGASSAVVMANDVLAEQNFNAEQSQTMTTECTYGSYGQSSTCKASGTQSQHISGKQIVYAPQVAGVSKTHTPVDTAVDPLTFSILLGLGLTGIGAFVGYLKIG